MASSNCYVQAEAAEEVPIVNVLIYLKYTNVRLPVYTYM